MLSKISYSSLFNYSPKGQSKTSIRSRKFCGSVKAGRPVIIEAAVGYLKNDASKGLLSFLNKETTLVPVPKSAPLVANAIWSPKIIAEKLLMYGFGKEVNPCISREYAIIKSSSQSSASSRPSVKEQFDSLSVRQEISHPKHITLIDDVITLGRTSFACAQRIAEAYPNAEVRMFSLIRTQGLIPDIEKFFDPSIGYISFNPNSGKTTRKP